MPPFKILDPPLLEQTAVDSAIDGKRVFACAYEPKEDILSSGNMLVE